MESEHANLTHLLISASAGSGKTYQLVRRYLHLLSLDQEPEGIAAMTFTRKAAGEFFNRILRRLAELAVEPAGAAKYFKGVQPSVDRAPDFGAMLRRLTRRMHRLRLGTLDSFFANITACFPLELGLPAGARVMDEVETRQARTEALDALLERLHSEDQAAALHALLEAFKQATFGAEEKGVEASLQDWAGSGATLWEDSECAASGPGRGWGDLRCIWQASAAVVQPQPPLEEVIAGVTASFVPPHDGGLELLEETLEAVRAMVPGMTVPKRVKELLEKISENLAELREGRGQLMWARKRLPLDARAAAALLKLAQTLLVRELLVRAERTRGLAKVMALYSGEYRQRVQARGRLSFADVQRLLARAAQSQSPWLTGEGELWFRMDGRYQHWLMDEFQDTSRVQWQVLAGLVDEVMQDANGDRSFFAVGDPKQSIYLWRQADPHLFGDILRLYPKNGARGLHRQPLTQSFRSAQPVLDAVNRVFGSKKLEGLLPAGSLTGFAFDAHEAAHEMSGCAVLLSPCATDAKSDQLRPVDLAAALLRHIQPLRRRLSCAVLVRQNSEVRVFTEELRTATGMQIACEADQHPVTDNAVTLGMLSLLTLAAHPADTLALEHLRMTPLWPLLHDDAGKSWRYHVAKILADVFQDGFAPWVESWTPRLREVLPALDEFHTLRWTQLMDIASEFDATGSRDMDAFVEFAREYPLRQRGAAQAVQVMTIHAAKGLEFDVVILPTLDGSALNNVKRTDLLVGRDHEGVRWVLQSPPKSYIPLDEVLHLESIEAERRAAFEGLCRLYVAMTRAKRGLYMIAAPAPKTGDALKECRLLRETLEVAPQPGVMDAVPVMTEWRTGDFDWHEGHPLQADAAPTVARVDVPLGQVLRDTQPLRRRRTPSAEESFVIKGRVLFSAGRDPGRRLGSMVHALLETVEWWSPGQDLNALIARWSGLGLLKGHPDEEAALSHVTTALTAAGCAAAFQPGSQRTRVWRERPFDLIHDGEWVSGVFDRVHIEHDESGRMTGAWLVDFKTDDIENEATMADKLQGYAPQIALYREAIGCLTRLPPQAIRTSLLFTATGRLADLGR